MVGTKHETELREQIERFAREAGADAFGVASAPEIEETLTGRRPTDLLKEARSVVVMARRIP